MTLKEKFDIWDKENPEVYKLFCKFTFQALERGHKRLSAWMVVNQIRWETSVVTTGDEYKVSNEFVALYSRKFMEEYPQHDGFFRVKKMKRV